MKDLLFENEQWSVTNEGEMFCKKGIFSLTPKQVISENIDWIEEMDKLKWLDMPQFISAFDAAYPVAKCHLLVMLPTLEKAKAWKAKHCLRKFKEIDFDPFMNTEKVAA